MSQHVAFPFQGLREAKNPARAVPRRVACFEFHGLGLGFGDWGFGFGFLGPHLTIVIAAH